MKKSIAAMFLLIFLNILGIHFWLKPNLGINFSLKRDIASEKPMSFDNQNTFVAITKETVFKKHPLELAIESNDEFKVKELTIQYPDYFNDNHQDALTLAVIYKAEKVFNFLMKNNISMENQDIYGMTAAMYAAKENEFKMLKILLKKEHDLTILSATEKTALDYARESRAIASINLLEKLEAPCNSSCKF